MRMRRIALCALLGAVHAACGAEMDGGGADESMAPIINGTLPHSTAWPYAVGVIDWYDFTFRDAEIDQYCGATLIHPQWVLTAAHCAPPDLKKSVFVLGRKDLLDRTTGQEVYGDGGAKHADYEPVSKDSDIAVVRLKSRTGLSTVELATPADMATFSQHATTTAMGWGYIGQGAEKPESLLEVNIPAILSADTCNATTNWGPEAANTVTQNQICAGELDGSKGVCVDDSGGPALIQSGGVWKQAGIVSYGRTSCVDAGYPAVFTRVDNFYDWVWSRLPASEGVGWFFTNDGTGGLASLRAHTGWASTWHRIVTGEFGGSTIVSDLAFYDQRRGVLALYLSDNAGGMSLLKSTSGLTQNGHLVVPGNFDGDGRTDLMIYDPVGRYLYFYTPDAAGNLTLLRRVTGVRPTWRNIVAGNWGGSSHTDLAFYDGTGGDMEIYRTDGTGSLSLVRRITSLRKTFQIIVPGQFAGDATTDLLFYDPTATGSSANLAFYTMSTSGTMTLLKVRAGFNRHVHTVLPSDFNGDAFTDLLFYDQDNQSLMLYSTDGSGNHTFLRGYEDIIATAPVVGNFGASARSDVLLYSRWNYGL